jgi:SAM-dependent methyltransferase
VEDALIGMKFFGTKEIKEIVRNFLISKADELRGKTVVDIPAGFGITTKVLRDIGARVEAYDLFPGFFKLKDMECRTADLAKTLPIEDNHADYVICQEGVEHLEDQLHMFREFNRILKKKGTLILTTPNYSNLKSRVSYLLAESEYACRMMPPNEIDSVWFSENNKMYYGHIFLIGIQKLKLLARLAGFRIKQVHTLRIHRTSLLLMFPFYPFILVANIMAYLRALKKRPEIDKEIKRRIYGESLRHNIDPKILSGRFMLVEFGKDNELDEVVQSIRHSAGQSEASEKEEELFKKLCG